MAKIKCPYTYPDQSRTRRARYITDFGGYGNRHDVWPVEFNVGVYSLNAGFDDLWKLREEYLPEDVEDDPDTLMVYYNFCKRMYPKYEDMLFNWAIEDAQRDVQGDDSFYSSLWDGTELRVEWEFAGRGGKHLVLCEFEGHRLRGLRAEDLHDQLMTYTRLDGDEVVGANKQKGAEWTFWSNEDILKLYKYLRQCAVDFSPANVASVMEHKIAFAFFCNAVEPEWASFKEELKTKEETKDAARAILEHGIDSSLLPALETLVVAAGLTLADLKD